MRTLHFSAAPDVPDAVAAVRAVVAAGGVALLPTETFYGLAADPASTAAVARVHALKDRPAGLALPVLCADWEQVTALAEVPEPHRVRLSRSWPGPLTVVLRCRRELAVGGGSTVAVRIPGHGLLRALLYRVGPLTGTSANHHGEPPCTTVAAALLSLAEAPELALDGGTTAGGVASTLVDLSGPEPRVLRPGPVAWG